MNCKYKYFYDRSLWCFVCLIEDNPEVQLDNKDTELSRLEEELDTAQKDLWQLNEDLRNKDDIIHRIHDLSG